MRHLSRPRIFIASTESHDLQAILKEQCTAFKTKICTDLQNYYQVHVLLPESNSYFDKLVFHKEMKYGRYTDSLIQNELELTAAISFQSSNFRIRVRCNPFVLAYLKVSIYIFISL